MAAIYEVPTKPNPLKFAITFPNKVSYIFRLIYLFTTYDCWLLDIDDSSGNSLVAGIPLVTGCDLLAPYAYLGFACSLYCTTDGDPTAPPRFYNLGRTAHLWLETPQAAA